MSLAYHSNIHFHLSQVQYTPKGGRRNILPPNSYISAKYLHKRQSVSVVLPFVYVWRKSEFFQTKISIFL